jgi:hypothetical protein
MKKFWYWNTHTDEETTHRTLFLQGVIAEESWLGDEITPKIFKEELENGTGDITVWLHSPGGDCIAAAQIYNMLLDYSGQVTVHIDGLAASAASVIAMAGSIVRMTPVSMLMIHNPMTIASGDTGDMQKAIDLLTEVKESIMNAYELKTGLARKEISELMDEETWMNAKKAISLGFADEMVHQGDAWQQEGAGTDEMMYSEKQVQQILRNKLIPPYTPIRTGRSVEKLKKALQDQYMEG